MWYFGGPTTTDSEFCHAAFVLHWLSNNHLDAAKAVALNLLIVATNIDSLIFLTCVANTILITIMIMIILYLIMGTAEFAHSASISVLHKDAFT